MPEMGSDEPSSPGTPPTRRRGPRRESPEPMLQLPERYEDRGEIARGGWGHVRRVFDRTIDHTVVMKILAWEHLDDPRTRSRFLNESRVTASLDHPGIVPVLDAGTLRDGRPWFTMKEVRGRTLQQILREKRDDAADPVRLRREIGLLLRVCETVGYAHGRGVVHRDLKPSNVMVGRFGEVLVLDWGIARWHDGPEDAPDRASRPSSGLVTEAGDILGTVAYMSPEQARGAFDEIRAASDVFALGLILYEILTRRRARSTGSRARVWMEATSGTVPSLDSETSLPADLRAIVARALRFRQEERYADAMELAAALRDWLDGASRRERAAEAVRAALAMNPEIARLRAERDACRAEARRLMVDVRPHDPVERKLPAWRLEDHAAELEQRLVALEAERVEMLRSALEHDRDYAPAHAELARTYRARLIEAEARGARAEALRAEIRLRQHDRGENASFLRGVGRVVLESDPPGARVRALRFVERDRRVIPQDPIDCGTAPISIELPVGSYLFVLERDGKEVRYPVVVERDRVWDTCRPGSADPVPIALDVTASDDEIYVPAGWTRVGDDELAAQPVPARRVWVDGFVMKRFPVTCAEYLEYLNDLRARGAVRECLERAPRATRAADGSLMVELDASGRYRMAPDEHGRPVDPAFPIASIDWHSAMAYAAWLAERTGQPWRLPNELEWEKAARGVDARPFPWGNQEEPTWACILGSTPDAPQRAVVDSYPVDESPYGVRGLAGNVRTWCINAWKPDGPELRDGIVMLDAAAPDDPGDRSIRGGAWASVPAFARSAGRFGAKPDERFSFVGMRLVRSV